MNGANWLLLIAAVAVLAVLLGVLIATGLADEISRHRWRSDRHAQLPAGALGQLVAPARPLSGAVSAIELVASALIVGLVAAIISREGVTQLVLIGGAVALASVAAALLVPKSWARANPVAAEHRLARWARVIVGLLTPLANVLDAGQRLVATLLFRRSGEGFIDEEVMGDAPPGPGDEEPDERAMIANVLRLERTSVREVMVPRVDVVAAPETSALPDLLAAITGGGHSRVPVYRGSIDRVVGVLYAKDLLPFVGGSAVTVPLADLLRPAYSVPESMRLDELLAELKRRRVHMAIVADEYGGTAGIVTIEDVLEEIVGEIQDEYDSEPPLIERLDGGGLLADGRLAIDDLASALGLSLEQREFETVAGLVHHHLGRMAEPGDQIDIEGLRIEVVEVEGHRLRQLRLERRPTDGGSPAAPAPAAHAFSADPEAEGEGGAR